MRGVAVRLYRFLLTIIIGLGLTHSVLANLPPEETAQLLPVKIGSFTAIGPVGQFPAKEEDEGYKIISLLTRAYRNAKGQSVAVNLYQTASDNAAYSLLQKSYHSGITKLGNEVEKRLPFATKGKSWVGHQSKKRFAEFFQGPVYVTLFTTADYPALIDFGQKLAETLDKGEGEIPSLVKHLPEGEKEQENAQYALTPKALKSGYAGNQPALEAINFAGGTEVVSATYSSGAMVIAEFATPQVATANDAAIQAKIKELQAANQNVPTAYKRVGNYGVFVFNAPDEATAQQLISQVQYEKTVQWLGANPNILIRAQKRYVAIASGVFFSVIKASGIAVLLALGLGGAIGGLVFRHRRAQDLTASAYSDAGGMLRLNLDEMTTETNPARLLEHSES